MAEPWHQSTLVETPTTIEDLKAKLELAVKALRRYADPNNWYESSTHFDTWAHGDGQEIAQHTLDDMGEKK